MPVFRPTARVRIQLRIDEGAETAALRATLERTAPAASLATGTIAGAAGAAGLDENFKRRLAVESARAKLSADELARERSALDRERQALQQAARGVGQSQTLPQGLTEAPQDERNVLFETLPVSVTVSRNGIKDADTAKLELNFRDLPIDPRVVRAALIAVSIGVVPADDWQAGVVSQAVRDTDGSLQSLVERAPGDELRFDSPTAFVGFVDEWLTEFGEDGDVLKCECRDLSAVLRDQILPPGVALATDVPIHVAVKDLIDLFPASRGLRVVYGTPVDPHDPLRVMTSDEPPVIAQALPEVLVAKGKRGKKQQKRRAAEESVWDHILEACIKVGLTPILRGFTLFIAEPRVLFSSFLGARRMVWGRNIKKLTFARKLGAVKADTIEVRCADPSIGWTRWARYPVLGSEPRSGILGKPGSPQPVTSRASSVTPNGQGHETVRTLLVRGVMDLEQLERVARNAFEEISRQEIEGSIETDEIESFDSQVAADLLLLQPGEPVTVTVAPPPELSPVETAVASGQRSIGTEAGAMRSTSSSSLQDLQAQSVAQRQAYLERLGMSPATARRLAVAQEQVALTSTFRASHVNISWDHDNGVSLDFDFHNFIVVREDIGDVPLQPEANVLSEAVANARSNPTRKAGF